MKPKYNAKTCLSFNRAQILSELPEVSQRLGVSSKVILEHYLPYFINMEKFERNYGKRRAAELFIQRNVKTAAKLRKKCPEFLDKW